MGSVLISKSLETLNFIHKLCACGSVVVRRSASPVAEEGEAVVTADVIDIFVFGEAAVLLNETGWETRAILSSQPHRATCSSIHSLGYAWGLIWAA
jgi:hypothetical protein